MTHQEPTSYQSWITNLQNAAQKQSGLPEGITLRNGTSLEFAEEVPDEAITNITVMMGVETQKNEFKNSLLRWNIGHAILVLAKRSNKEQMEIVQDYKLAERTGLDSKTLYNWSNVARKTPPRLLKPGVSWAVIQALAEPRMPEDDPERMALLMDEKEKIVTDLTQDPSSSTYRDAKKRIEKMMVDQGEKPQPPPDRLQMLQIYACLLRKLRFVDESGSTPESLEAVGYKERQGLVDGIEAAEVSCLNLRLIPEKV
jgi:hypothetical protein